MPWRRKSIVGTTDPAESDKPPSPSGAEADLEPGEHPRVTAIVLAAGRGTRMRSDLPKGLHPLVGASHGAARAAGTAGCGRAPGGGGDGVWGGADGGGGGCGGAAGLEVRFARQSEALGTGHATLQAKLAAPDGDLLIVNGDVPLLRAEDVCAVLAAPPARLVLAAARVPDPTNLGRVRREGERLVAVVEEADADRETKAIREVNVGLYRAEAGWLWRTLESLGRSASGEIYLTDAVAQAASEGEATAVTIDASDGSLSVESRRDLARAERVLRLRINEGWLDAGVTIVDPAATYIDAGVEIGADCRIEPGTHLRGATRLGAGSVVGPNSVVIDTQTGEGCALVQCRSEGAVLADHVDVGAFSTLREGTMLEDSVHIGTHAETKNAHLHRGVMMGHFSYLGDVVVGEESNIGAGAITCNFDGVGEAARRRSGSAVSWAVTRCWLRRSCWRMTRRRRRGRW